MARRMVKFLVDAEFIIKGLNLPGETQIYNITRHDFIPDCFVFYVEHPELPELMPGETPLLIMPIFQADYDNLIPAEKMIDWGIK